MQVVWWLLALHFVALIRSVPRGAVDNGEEGKAFWMGKAQEELEEALRVGLNMRVAKNVILILGDGMGLSTITAARIYKGQLAGEKGEGTKLSFETFPFVALSKTYSADRQTSASASTATAIVSGVKNNYGTVGFDQHVKRGDCDLVNNTSVRLTTMLDWSQAAGKSVGIVTNTRVTHASPSATYAHSPDRNWEMKTPDDCPLLDIATQLLIDNANITVIMGGGRRGFQSSTRPDQKNLVEEWQTTKQEEGKTAKYVQNAQELRDLNVADTDHLLGLFTESHMSWELDRDNDQEPSLAEMVGRAIEVLSKNDKGYFLFVEGGRIDHAHHDNWGKRALSETVSLDAAVQKALTMVNQEDTLIVVTADHSHPFNIQGYPSRGNDILGVVDVVDEGQAATDNKPYTTLVYANGPGPNRSQVINEADLKKDDFRYQVVVPFQEEWETHSGEDVAIYATGPMAHLFHGVHEQNYIAHVMAYAACVGPNKKHCQGGTQPVACTGGAGAVIGGEGRVGRALLPLLLLAALTVFVRF